jgi:hypothetical protein
MAFKRSFWWGISGSLLASVVGFIALLGSKPIGEACADFLLWLGLNPREQAPLCLLLLLTITLTIGFIAGRGLRIGRPPA